MNSFKLTAVGHLARNPELVAKGDTLYTRFCLVGNDYAGRDEEGAARLLFNLMLTLEAFLLTKNLLTLLCCAPIHGVFVILCSRDARFFDLLLLWGRTRLPAAFGNLRVWRASSYNPLLIDVPSRFGSRRKRVKSW
jgi:type IV secretion system protein VirB3